MIPTAINKNLSAVIIPKKLPARIKGGPIRPIRIEGGDAFISLSRGEEAVIDVADAPLVSGRSWTLHVDTGGKKYAKSRFVGDDGKVKVFTLHRYLTGAGPTEEADHEDGDGLNNRRKNLRVCTRQQNSWNRNIGKNNKSGYRNVVFRPEWGTYEVKIRYKNKRFQVGSFPTAIEAALAFDREAERLYGEFALLNFPSLTNPKIRSIYPNRPDQP